MDYVKHRVKICSVDKPGHIEVYIDDKKQLRIAYIKWLDDCTGIKLGEEFTVKCRVLRDCHGVGTVIIMKIERCGS